MGGNGRERNDTGAGSCGNKIGVRRQWRGDRGGPPVRAAAPHCRDEAPLGRPGRPATVDIPAKVPLPDAPPEDKLRENAAGIFFAFHGASIPPSIRSPECIPHTLGRKFLPQQRIPRCSDVCTDASLAHFVARGP